MLDKRSFYINGSWVEPQITNDFNVIDPSTDCLLYTSPSPRD